MTESCYVYAIVGRETASFPVHFEDDATELAIVPWRGLAAVTGRLPADCAAVTMQAVLHHEAVVEAVRRQGPALPVRFGTVFRDAKSVATALADRYEPLAADLDRVGDKVELSLTALWATPPSADGPAPAAVGKTAGARYLHGRAAALRREEELKEMAQSVAQELDQVLGGLAIERRVSLLPTPRVAVRTAYLLNSAQVNAFRASFEAVRRMRVELRVLLTGPWPPYSFVTRPTEDGSHAGGRVSAFVQLLTDELQARSG